MAPAPAPVPDRPAEWAAQPMDAEAGSKAAAAAAAAAAPPLGAEEDQRALQERLGAYLTGAVTANMVFLGDQLGLYAALEARGPCTAAQLAAATGLAERYVAEWLRQQAAARLVATDADAEQFWLTPAQADVLARERGPQASPHFAAGTFSAMPAMTRFVEQRLPQLFRSGGGVGYNEVDPAVTCGVCRELGVWARHELVPCLLATPGVREALQAGCMVADVGCGCGEALLAVAAAFPSCTCHGFDISQDALDAAKAEAARRRLPNCAFLNNGLREEALPAAPTYQVVMTHDAVHDMAHPLPVMRAVRRALAPGGCWVVGDMKALDSHAANIHHHPMAAVQYGFSLHCCLPSGLSAPGGAGLGTLGISADLMCAMLREAGFGSAEVLETWEHPLNRYYMARP